MSAREGRASRPGTGLAACGAIPARRSPDVRADLKLLRVDLFLDDGKVLDAPLWFVEWCGEVGQEARHQFFERGGGERGERRGETRTDSSQLTLYVPVVGLPPSSSSPRSLASTMSVCCGVVGVGDGERSGASGRGESESERHSGVVKVVSRSTTCHQNAPIGPVIAVASGCCACGE